MRWNVHPIGKNQDGVSMCIVNGVNYVRLDDFIQTLLEEDKRQTEKHYNYSWE